MWSFVQRELDQQGDKTVPAVLGGTNPAIPCETWEADLDPIPLPPLPTLPDLDGETVGNQQPTQLIKIAGMDNHLIGLTNKGHVLKFGSLHNDSMVSRGSWEYLPEFSELHRVREHPTFTQQGIEAPDTMKITHISANFLNFMAYSIGPSSIVLMGDTNTTPASSPKILPALQNKSIISVVLGDYHNVALTSSGEVMTWGAYSAGASGLGDPIILAPGTPGGFETEQARSTAEEERSGEPPAVEIPCKVRFDHGLRKPKDRFCFAIAAAGWHTGALVMDLEPDSDNSEEVAGPAVLG